MTDKRISGCCRLIAQLSLLPLLVLVSCGDDASQTMDYKGIEVHKPIPDPQLQEVALLVAYAWPDDGDIPLPRNGLAPGERLQLDFVTTHFSKTESAKLGPGATWEVSDPSVVAIEKDQYLRGLQEGEATVCGRNGKYRACQVFVVRQALYHYRSSSSAGTWHEENAVAADGWEVLDEDYYPALTIGGGHEADLSRLSRDGRWLFKVQERTLTDLRTGALFDAPMAPDSEPDWDYGPYYHLQATEDGLLILFDHEFALYAAHCSHDACPDGLVPVLQPDPDNDIHYTADIAPDGTWLAIVRWADGTPPQLVRADAPDWAESTLVPPAPGRIVTHVRGPVISPDGSTVAWGTVGDAADNPALADAQGHAGVLDVQTGELLVDEHLALQAAPTFSRDGRFVLLERASGGLVFDLERRTWVDVAPGGNWTPWNTLHYACEDDAWEFDPASEIYLPSRYFLPMFLLDPLGRQASLTNLYAPVGVPGPQDDPWWDLQWISSHARPAGPPSALDQADDPGRFIAFAMALTFNGVQEETGLRVRTVLQVRPLDQDGQPTAIMPGNQQVSAFDVADSGLIFLVTDPNGYLVVTDPEMRRSAILAIGVSGPVTAAADGATVAAMGPGGQHIAWDVATGTELFRAQDLLSVCLQPQGESVVGVTAQREIVQRFPDGSQIILSDNGLLPDEHSGYGLHQHSWSDDCMTLLQVRRRGAARLHRLVEGDSFTIAGDIMGEIDHGGLAPDGSAYALTSNDWRWVKEMDGLLNTEIRLTELHVGRPPDWKPETVVTYQGFSGNVRSGITVDLGRPEVFPDATRVLVPYTFFLFSSGWSPQGAWGATNSYIHLLDIDIASGKVKNLQQVDVADAYQQSGAIARVRQ